MHRRRKRQNRTAVWLLGLLLLVACFRWGDFSTQKDETVSESTTQDGDWKQYTGDAYTVLCDNQPLFTEEEYTTESFETYSELDALGRCGVAYANVGPDLMPTEERGAIGHVKPTGWHTVKYNDLIDGNYLYNRCHLIAYELSGENANTKNLITGTRYMNVQGMLPFENKVAAYVKKTGNHVLYRVTPIFEDANLVASGVTMEAYSVEDSGEGICFYVYVYNVQPGIGIDYATGESWREE
jgi:DNA-entry nuclease